MVATLAGIELADYQMDMPLVVDFEDLDAERALPVFRPA